MKKCFSFIFVFILVFFFSSLLGAEEKESPSSLSRASSVEPQEAGFVTPFEEQAILEYLSSKHPEKYKQIISLQEGNKALYEKNLIHLKETLQPYGIFDTNAETAALQVQKTIVQLSPGREKELLDYIAQRYPNNYESFRKLKETRPDFYWNSLNEYSQQRQKDEIVKKAQDSVASLGTPEEKEVLAFAAQEFPDQYKSLITVKDSSPLLYAQQLAHFKIMRDNYITLEKNNPEVFERFKELQHKQHAAGSETISVSEEKEVLAFAAQEFPDQYKSLITVKDSSPLLYAQQLAHFKIMRDNYITLEKNNPEVFERLKKLQARKKN